MIKNNTIYFGYGDIALNGSFRKIYLNWIEPAQECGTRVYDNQCTILQSVQIKVKYEDFAIFQKIKRKEITSMEVDGWILDFTNYNQKSISSVWTAFMGALQMDFSVYAC